ncbi:MAG: PTS sugar transporter subunit IIA, partial [Acidobacteriota bacterium]
LVVVPLAGRSRDEVLREMVDRLRSCHAADGQDILAKLLEREGLGTTAIAGGVAVPHCKIAGLKAPVLALGVSRQGVAFQSIDGKSTHVIFLIVSPLEQPNVNLRLLASIAGLVRKSEVLPVRLRNAATAGEALRVLHEEEDGHHA